MARKVWQRNFAAGHGLEKALNAARSSAPSTPIQSPPGGSSAQELQALVDADVGADGFVLSSFTADDAVELGNLLYARLLPFAREGRATLISISAGAGSQTLYQVATGSGVTPDNESWVRRKTAAVLRFGTSSWYLGQKYSGNEAAFAAKFSLGPSEAVEVEDKLAREAGWFSEEATEKRKSANGGKDYGPAYVVAGVHEDRVINEWKGVNYPIMNIYERGLCVLQCKYINAAVFGAPFTPTKSYLTDLPWGIPDAVYHGPTAFMPLTYDPYRAPKEMGIYRQIGEHTFSHVNAGEIVQRIMKSRDMYEARQRAKGVKAEVEAAARAREMMEEEQRKKEAERGVMSS